MRNMGEFCLGAYLQILFNARIEDRSITKKFFVGEILSSLSNNYDPGSTIVSKLFTGINNLPVEYTAVLKFLDEEKYQAVVELFEKSIVPLINPNKLPDAIRALEVAIATDDEIKPDTVIAPFTGIKKKDLTGTIDKPADFLAGVFLYVISYKKNPGRSGVVKPYVTHILTTTPGYVFEIERKHIEIRKLEYDAHDEKTDQEANSFCIKNYSKKGLIPLCQIVYATNPIRKHSRAMYNDFCCQTMTTRNKIIEAADIYLIDDISERNWWYEYLGQFEKDYKRFELGEDRYLYMFGQYFPDLIEFGDKPVDEYLTRVFSPKVDSIPGIPDYKVDMLYLIDEYIHYREDKNYRSVLEPPVDFLARELDFPGCPDEALAAYLSFVIIGTCCAIPKGGPENCTVEKTSGVSIYDIETAEDLFYFTLLKLYETYNEVVEKRQDQCEN